MAIAPNGSFSGTAIEHGVFDNANAEFTYSFAGFFEGATPAGPETVAGTLRRRRRVCRQWDKGNLHVKSPTLVGNSHFLGQLKLNIRGGMSSPCSRTQAWAAIWTASQGDPSGGL